MHQKSSCLVTPEAVGSDKVELTTLNAKPYANKKITSQFEQFKVVA